MIDWCHRAFYVTEREKSNRCGSMAVINCSNAGMKGVFLTLF